MSQSQPK